MTYQQKDGKSIKPDFIDFTPLYVVGLWIVVIVVMSLTDVALGGLADQNFRVSAWLIELFIGVLGTVALSFIPKVGIGLAMTIGGMFLSIYNLTWIGGVIVAGEGLGQEIALYPFGFTVPLWEFLLLIVIGFVLFITGLSLVVSGASGDPKYSYRRLLHWAWHLQDGYSDEKDWFK